MRRFYIFLSLLLSLTFALETFAQQQFINGEPWYCEYYSNRISDDGDNLWLATSKGLIKYNKSIGYAYNAAKEVGAIPESKYTVVEVNTQGVVCYAEDKRYEMPKMWNGTELIDYGNFSHWDGCYSFAFNSKEEVWGAVAGSYFPPVDSTSHYDGYHLSNNISSAVRAAVMDVAFDSNDRLWIAMYGDYHYMGYHNNKPITSSDATIYVGENGDNHKMITSIAIDANDNIWYASEDGINCYNQATGVEMCMTKEQYPAMLENRYFGNDIDAEGNIWFTSENNLLKWNGSEFTTYTCTGYEEARSMLCDGDIVWVLLKNDTLLKFEDNQFEAIDLSPVVNNEEYATIPRGIELDRDAFGIPVNQLGFDALSEFTLSFWINAKIFNHTLVDNGGTNFLTIRDVTDSWPNSDYGYMWSQIGNTSEQNFDNRIIIDARVGLSGGATSIELSPIEFNASEWKHFSFVFDVENNYRKILLYVDGTLSYEVKYINDQTPWNENSIIMIGGARYKLGKLEAYIDKVQLYGKALSLSEVQESMKAPLQDDTSLLACWDFEGGCTIDSEGYMLSDNGPIKAAMYKISSLGGVSSGIEIIPFAYGEGVMDIEFGNTPQGVEQNISDKEQTKAFVSNGILNIEKTEGINSVVVYDAMGRVIISSNLNGATSTQIALPLNISGVIIVKVDSEVIKQVLR